MGQKSNTLTLRKTYKNLSFQGTKKESKQFLYGLKFLSFLEQLLNQKNMSYGLFSIQERLTDLGGSFAIDSVINKGTKATISIPIKIKDKDEI